MWVIAKLGRVVGSGIGYIKRTSKAKLAFDALNIVSIGSDLVDLASGSEKTSNNASNYSEKVMSKEEYEASIDKFTKPTISVDPDQRELAPNKAGSNESTTAITGNTLKAVTSLNSALKRLLDQVGLADDDDNVETAYLYDLYFISNLREIALKRWPTIRNYQNAYTFSSMLKEKQEEQTYEEMILIVFYFRMV